MDRCLSLRHDDGRNDIYGQPTAGKQGKGDEAQPDKGGVDAKVFPDPAAYTGDFFCWYCFYEAASS